MKTIFRGVVTAGAGVILGIGAIAIVLLEAAPLQADPGTFWNLLGIPQGTQKMRDARANRLGNNPQRERVPPLKRIADPANLESQNPAIKAAAQIKKDQDMAPQKIKAIKYLGSIACCCPTNKDDVKNALLAALDDCTDEVRQAAATAICQASGNPCTICNQCSCCTADVMNKLNQMANEQDEKGCWIESNPTVRQAASLALEACRRVRGPEPAVEAPPVKEEPKERRVPTAPKDPAYSTPQSPSPPAPGKTSPKPATKPATKSADAPAADAEGWKVRPASAESPDVGFVLITDPIREPAAKPQAATKPAQKPHLAPKRVEKKAEQSPKPVEQKPAPTTTPEPKPLPAASPAEPKLLIKFSAAD